MHIGHCFNNGNMEVDPKTVGHFVLLMIFLWSARLYELSTKFAFSSSIHIDFYTHFFLTWAFTVAVKP